MAPQQFAYQNDDGQDAESEFFNKPEFALQQRHAEPKPQQVSHLFAAQQQPQPQQHQQQAQPHRLQQQHPTNQNFALYYQQVSPTHSALNNCRVWKAIKWHHRRWRYFDWQAQQVQRQQQQIAASAQQPSFHYQQAANDANEESAQQYQHYQQPVQYKQAAAPAHPQKVTYSPASEVSHVKYESEGVNYSF